VHGLAGLGIAQSTHWYDPVQLTFYRGNWVEGSDKWPEPAWPLKSGWSGMVTKEKLRQDLIEPWGALERKGVGVHVGEFGFYIHTPHAVGMAWMKDCLELWKEKGWGWALWNLRGEFGVLDSGRTDVKYEGFRGHKLDRDMLGLLQSY
jgi:endoglucanase